MEQAYKNSKAFDLAINLIKGRTIDRIEIEPVKKEVSMVLTSFKNNANLVLRQLKKER